MGSFKIPMLVTVALLEVGNLLNYGLLKEIYFTRILPNNIEMYNDRELMFADNQLTE